MTIVVTPADLSGYNVFNVTGPNSNHVTIAIKGKLIENCRMDDRPRFTISILIWGDFGPWQYHWSHAGGEGETWWNWLEDTDKSYFFGKLCGNASHEFDLDRSIAMAHKQIEELWKDVKDSPGVRRDDFHQAHHDLNQTKDTNKLTFFEAVSSLTYQCTAISAGVGSFTRHDNMFEEYWEMGYTRMKPRLVWFWDNIWRPFIEQAKRTEGFTKPDMVG